MNKFAFIIHPIELADIYRKFPLMSKLPDNFVERVFKFVPPVKISKIEGVRSIEGPEVEGYFIACPLTTNQLLTLPEEVSLKKIIASVKTAEQLGAQIVGLGAMTSVVGDAGVTVAKNSNIPVTTGNTYTVASAIEGTLEAAALMDIDITSANVVILGATGSIGSVAARMLAKRCKYLTLLARSKDKLTQLARRILYESGIAVQVSDDSRNVLRKADIIISVTSASDAVIQPEDLKPGAVVCDVARPRDVSFQVQEARQDVLVVEGGVIKVPGPVNFNFNFGFPPGLAYACMAETIILALEGRFESFSLGRDLSMEKVEEITALAKKHGFKLSGLRSFERAITPEIIREVKRARSKKLQVV